MQIHSLKLFQPKSHIIVPAAGSPDGKKYCFTYFGENVNFLEVYRSLMIKPTQVRYIMVPTTQKPITKLTPELRKVYINHKLRPVKMKFGEYEKYSNINYYMDITTYLNSLSNKWNLTKFNTGKGLKVVTSLLNTIDGIPSDTHERVLLYAVNRDKPLNQRLFFRRVFPVLKLFMSGDTIPFDKFIMFNYDSESGSYVLLYDKDKKVSVNRIKNYLLKMRPGDMDQEEISDEKIITGNVVDSVSSNKEEVSSAVSNYMKVDPSIKNDIDPEKAEDIAVKSVAYHKFGDVDMAKEFTKRLAPQEKKKFIKRESKNLLNRSKATTVSKSAFINMVDVPKLIDNEVPTHILDKRKRDFNENLEEDLQNIFKILEKKDIPLKVNSLEKKVLRSPPSELYPTLKDRYTIKLLDPDRKVHTVNLELPHLQEDGTFLINGVQRVIINQLVAYPIFFFKPFYGQFTSAYSSFTIHSKQIKKGAYLMGFMSGYKMPLILLLSTLMGFKTTCDLFNVKYSISTIKSENSIKIQNNQFLEYDAPTLAGGELMNGMNYLVQYLSEKGNLEDSDYWKRTLIRFTGTRNSIYLLEMTWKNIVTPIEVEVLQAKGDPFELPKITKYIADGVVEGRVDDRNSLDVNRVRTSEVFTVLIGKQINAAYNEYLAKKLGGDESAKLELNSTRVYSEVINSQNVQMMESINPMEEISMVTRISPIGVGGIPDKRAMTGAAMNIHHTYYGNIDPLETPDGASVGILQHLTVGAAIINKRGQFGVKDPEFVSGGEILSAGPASIPFVESNDGARVTMAAGQMKQALPLSDPEVPAIQTGYEAVLTDLLSDNFIKRSHVGGTIIKLDRNLMSIKKEDGTLENIDMTPRTLVSGEGKSGLSVFVPIVNVGQKIKKGQIIAEGGGIKNGIISSGKNMLVAFMPWKGYNFEDASVMSESAASKFTSVHVEKESVYLLEDEEIISIVEEGDVRLKGGILMTHTSAVEDIESYRNLRTDGGKVAAVEIYANMDTIPKKLQPLYENFKARFIALHGKYPQGTFKEKGNKFEGILIKFIVQQELTLQKGDKMNNRYFNKGVVSVIEPDDNMPLTPWGERIDMILNPLSVINRMNNGQILELHTSLISWKLGQMIPIMSRSKFVPIYTKILGLLDGTKGKTYSKSLIQKLNSLTDSSYQKVVNEVKDSRFVPFIFPPFKTPPRENILKAMAVLGLTPRTSLHIPGYGKTKEKVAVGYIYVQKLEHLASKKLASRSVGGYVSKTMSPTAGKKREGGQKIGEGDLYSLLAWDCPHVIEEMFGALSSDHVTKNEMISEIVQTGQGEFKESKTNPVKEMLTNYMLAVHLESN